MESHCDILAEVGHRLNDIIVKEHSSGNCVWKRESVVG